MSNRRDDSSDKYIVWDSRNGNVQPALDSWEGPEDAYYSRTAAEGVAAQLNRYVLKNTMPAFADMAVKVEGPFYARHASLRKQLEGRGMR